MKNQIFRTCQIPSRVVQIPILKMIKQSSSDLIISSVCYFLFLCLFLVFCSSAFFFVFMFYVVCSKMNIVNNCLLGRSV